MKKSLQTQYKFDIIKISILVCELWNQKAVLKLSCCKNFRYFYQCCNATYAEADEAFAAAPADGGKR